MTFPMILRVIVLIFLTLFHASSVHAFQSAGLSPLKYNRKLYSTAKVEKKDKADQVASALVVTAATVASIISVKVMVDVVTPIITLSGR